MNRLFKKIEAWEKRHPVITSIFLWQLGLYEETADVTSDLADEAMHEYLENLFEV